MKRGTLILLTFLLSYITLFCQITGKKEIVIGIYDDPPAIYMESGQVKGYFYDIFTEIFKDTEYKLSHRYGTWAEIMEWLRTGEIDAIYDIAVSEERKKSFDFNEETIFLSWGVIYGKQGIEINSLVDLKDLKIAVVDDDVYYEGHNDSLKEVLGALDIRPQFVETGGFTDTVNKVSEGLADVCVVPREFADFVLRDKLEFIQTPIIFKPISINIAFKKDTEYANELIPLIDGILSKEKHGSDSFYFRAINKYTTNRVIYKDNIVIKKVLNYKILALIILPIILIFALIYNYNLKRKIKIITANLIKTNSELKELSIKDPLTGLFNRRHFEETFQEELKIAKQYSRSLSFIIMDLDYFKLINDNYGHLIGDNVIKVISSLLIENSRENDIVSRYGGEEFAILLPNLNIKQANEYAKKLRAIIENTQFDKLEKNITITCGISEYNSCNTNMDKIISTADHALYAGKESGRNKVVVYKNNNK